MTVLAHEQAVAVLTIIHPDATSTTRVFIEDDHHELDPFHRAVKRRDAVLAERPESKATIGINERALDAATVTRMHDAGFPAYDLLDAEQTRQAIDEVKNDS
ncbi:hypothetical protein RF644_17690 [Kocuria sp. CPCC 205258]|uniref:hypothetical protein n=1 Tax=Kocuria sp. CPCC 205258 TaxID=3073552 RepID=UPI0034D4F662